MKIFVLTPIYATSTSNQGATPVVHYFTREWVKMGCDVTVFFFEANYPKFFYWLGKCFKHQLNTRLGMLVPVKKPHDDDYETEGVIVHRRCLTKFIPHSLYSNNQLERAINIIDIEVSKQGEPDLFIGHWDNPQLELLDKLKKRYMKPTCLVLHENNFDFEKKYGTIYFELLNNLDIIGFRSKVAQRRYIEKYGLPMHSFIASSGVSRPFLAEGASLPNSIEHPVRNFVFVGSLIERKYPAVIIEALSCVYPNGDFTMTYIGDGAEKSVIEDKYNKLGGVGKLCFTGRLTREETIKHLKQADVFVMISKDEIFGLVYLEAMALGLIPVGSRNEGIDGIICDGDNGFLCEAGNVEELKCVLKHIKNMSLKQLSTILKNAKDTAMEYSDYCVAEKYIENLKTIL